MKRRVVQSPLRDASLLTSNIGALFIDSTTRSQTSARLSLLPFVAWVSASWGTPSLFSARRNASRRMENRSARGPPIRCEARYCASGRQNKRHLPCFISLGVKEAPMRHFKKASPTVWVFGVRSPRRRGRSRPVLCQWRQASGGARISRDVISF